VTPLEKSLVSRRSILLVSLATSGFALAAPNMALASVGPVAPGPGILGLVAIGVVMAIAVARSRK
jgi:hypothetical protein